MQASLLLYFNPELKTMLGTDAFDRIDAVVLSELHEDKEWYPVALFSKSISLAELNYSFHDKEMLVIICWLSNCRAELQGSNKKNKIVTWNKGLEYLVTTKNLTARQARWSETL